MCVGEGLLGWGHSLGVKLDRKFEDPTTSYTSH